MRLLLLLLSVIIGIKSVTAEEASIPQIINSSSIKDDVELEKAFIFNEFTSYLGSDSENRFKEKLSKLKLEFIALEDKVEQVKLEETKDLRAVLRSKINEKLPLKDIPEKPELISKLDSEIKAIENNIESLDQKITSKIEELNSLKDVQTEYNDNLLEISNLITETKDEITRVETFLKNDLNDDQIKNQDLISYLKKYMPPQAEIGVLTGIYSNKLSDILQSEDTVIAGDRKGFKDVPQGLAYILWHDAEDRFYNLKDFSSSIFKLPTFKPVKVSPSFEDNIEILEEIYTFENLPTDDGWLRKEYNDYAACMNHNSFKNAKAVSEICSTLFPNQAYLNVTVDRGLMDYGSTPHILSISAAAKVSKLMKLFLADAKVLLANEYPKSFIKVTVDALNDHLKVMDDDLEKLYSDEGILNEKVSSGTAQMKKIEEDLLQLKSNIKHSEERLPLRLKSLKQEDDQYQLEFGKAKLHNEKLEKQKLSEVSALQSKLNEAETEIMSRYSMDLNLAEEKILKTDKHIEKLASYSKSAEIEQSRIQARLLYKYKRDYIRDNLSSKFEFSKTVLPKYRKLCLSFKLGGNLFLTEPRKINIKFKGTIVPSEVRDHVTGFGIGFNFPTYKNKYNEIVAGISPNKSSSTNIPFCNDVMSLTFRGATARFFERKGNDVLVTENWSLEAIGADLGYEDKIQQLTEWRGSGGPAYGQVPSNDSEIFGHRIADLRQRAEVQYRLSIELTERLIDFEEPQDVMLVQSVLNASGYYSGSIDGKWGAGSNSAMKEYMATKSINFETKDDWSIALQKQLLEN